MPASDDSPQPKMPAYEEYWSDLRRFFAKNARQPSEIEDMVQTVYLRLLKYPKEEVLRDPRDYIFRIAWNVVNDANGRAKKEADRAVVCDQGGLDSYAAVEGPASGVDEGLERLHTQTEIDKVLKKLPKKQRAALLLHKREGWSHKEIGAKMSVSEHTVKSWIRMSIQAFREHFRRSRSAKPRRGLKP